MSNNVKQIQEEVLKAFTEEIPSLYFSDKTESEYRNHCEQFEYFYHHLLKLPPRMFENQSILDFGAGTGESTIYFSNWNHKFYSV